MSVEQEVKTLNEKRMNLISQAREILLRASSEKRELTHEESANHEKAMDDITRIDKTREALITSDRAEEEFHRVNDELNRVSTPEVRADRVQRDKQLEADVASIFRQDAHSPGVNAVELDLSIPARVYSRARSGIPMDEFRVIQTDAGASGGSLTVPTTVSTAIYAYMTASVAMRRMGCTIITTDAGNAMNFPKVATHGIGTQVASQTTAFAGTDPVLGQMTLNAYDFGQLTAISNDMLEDSGVDVLGFVARQIGRAIGQVTATGYVTGSGSSTIQGIEGAVVGAGTVASGGSLFGLPAGQELEKLIDLQYSIADSYRLNGAAWLMRDLTGARIRKIRDGAGGTAGQFVWQPSPTVGAIGGQPDTFLGDPVYFDPNVASMASNAKIVYYGDWSAYYIRDTRQFRLERSDDLYFNLNQVAFRGLLRTDGDLIDANAINVLKQSV